MTEVYLEEVPRRTFAAALDWPGWARAARTREAALAALADYAPRYAPVAGRAGVPLPAGAGDELTVVEVVPGDAGTDFGVLGKVASADARPVTAAEAGRAAALLEASWAVFAEVVGAAPAELRKGPRGGGRDRDAIVEHVTRAEESYARKVGLKVRVPEPYGLAEAAELRAAVLTVLARESDGSPLAPRGWPARYAVRRFAWHVLDHAWEIEDRAVP